MARGGRGAKAQLMTAEWNKSVSTRATLMRLVTASVMAEAAISGWRISPGENYPDPRPDEIVVFEDFYWHGFENPCHPFLRKLCDYYKGSIYNLHPNSVLAVIIIKVASTISTPTLHYPL
jgi:hypothetical protein